MPRADVAAAYDARAEEYIQRFGTVDRMSAEDRATIESWGDGTVGRILDAGCGPGHWSGLLARGGERNVVGIDASARFIGSAQRCIPHVPFLVGDLASLPLASGSFGAVLSWFSIIHTAPGEVPATLAEFARVLSPGGSLLLGFFDGESGVAFDHAVTTAYRWSVAGLADLFADHGFVVESSSTRQDPVGKRSYGQVSATLGPT